MNADVMSKCAELRKSFQAAVGDFYVDVRQGDLHHPCIYTPSKSVSGPNERYFEVAMPYDLIRDRLGSTLMNAIEKECDLISVKRLMNWQGEPLFPHLTATISSTRRPEVYPLIPGKAVPTVADHYKLIQELEVLKARNLTHDGIFKDHDVRVHMRLNAYAARLGSTDNLASRIRVKFTLLKLGIMY